MKNIVYLIKNIEEYGKLMAFCIDHDISVWRTYWDEREKGNRCYYINWKEKRCYYSSLDYYQGKYRFDDIEYEIVEPIFEFDKYGTVEIVKTWR